MHHHVLHKWKYATKQIHKSRLNFSTWSTLCKSNDFQDQFEQRREAIANGPGLEILFLVTLWMMNGKIILVNLLENRAWKG